MTRILTGLLALGTALGQSVPLIVEPVDESRRTVLTGNTRIDLRPEFDRGPLDDAFRLNGMQLLLRRSPEREQAAEALADDLNRAGSPRFHQWLTAERYAEQFGVAPEDIAKIGDWLRAHGFTVHAPSPSRMTIDFSGAAGQVREAFGTEIHALEVNGERHIANVRDPSIPAALAPAIEGIVSLNDFRPRPALVPRSQYTFTFDGYTIFGVAPADLATIYNFSPLFSAGITGLGQTIALIEDTDLYAADDWTTFRKTFGLDAYAGGSLMTVHPGGCADPGVNPNGDDREAALDVEWASAAAPSAALRLATCADTAVLFGGLVALQNLVNQHDAPPIVSMSYAECEAQGATLNAAFRAVYQQAVMEGVSVFVAAGDDGPAMCDTDALAPAQSGVTVNGMASTAYNVAVGGTDFGDVYAGTYSNYWSQTNSPTYGSALSYVPEIPWNDTCASTLTTSYQGYSVPYGANGFCAAASALLTFSAPSAAEEGLATAPPVLPRAASPAQRLPTVLARAGRSRVGRTFWGTRRMAFETCRMSPCSRPMGYGASFTCSATRIRALECRAWERRATGLSTEAPRSRRRSWPASRRW
jgi:hypothetical protein